ncbi:hypothetical protein [Streptomyces sp. NBC_01718]
MSVEHEDLDLRPLTALAPGPPPASAGPSPSGWPPTECPSS